MVGKSSLSASTVLLQQTDADVTLTASIQRSHLHRYGTAMETSDSSTFADKDLLIAAVFTTEKRYVPGLHRDHLERVGCHVI